MHTWEYPYGCNNIFEWVCCSFSGIYFTWFNIKHFHNVRASFSRWRKIFCTSYQTISSLIRFQSNEHNQKEWNSVNMSRVFIVHYVLIFGDSLQRHWTISNHLYPSHYLSVRFVCLDTYLPSLLILTLFYLFLVSHSPSRKKIKISKD